MAARKQPFCNMCFKTGKSEQEYTSHWLRDRAGPGGVVVCPYLLSVECRYCRRKGHTISHCPVLQLKKSSPILGPPPPLVMPANRKVRAQFAEPLGPPPPLVMPQFAEPVVQPIVQPIVREKPVVHEKPWWLRPVVDVKKPVVDVKKTVVDVKKPKKMCWADVCDSDYEDDDC